ncbi:MAG TPA: choice-of-anchor V domain-containing protein [Bacteroidia bacterium]|nr:choice-of-anchor V domain-containing protein [Bacteroidia bacterium]
MNKKVTLPLISGAAILMLSASTVINSSGISNYSGSPVDGGPTTTGQCSGCHSGGSSVPTLAVTSSPAFGGSGSNRTYIPSTSYTITITPTGSSYSRFGFNAEIINSLSAATASVANFGTFGAAVGVNTQITSATANAPYPSCALHTSRSTTTPFAFKWTAPASGTGYICANVLGCNGDGNTSGDKVSAVTTITLTPNTTGIENHAENVNALSLFPNPATDNLRITYTLRERGAVSVKLFNLNGDLVADLLNETQEVGVQANDVHLPSGLANGMYMVKLSVNGQQSTQKLMVY